MTGFGVDVGQLGSLTGKVSDVGDTLTNTAGSIGELGECDFGHPQLNQVMSQTSGLLNEYLSGLGQHVGGMVGNLQSTMQSYSGSDAAGTQAFSGVTDAAGGFGESVPASDPSTAIKDFHSTASDTFQSAPSSGDSSSSQDDSGSKDLMSDDGNSNGPFGSSGPFGLGNNPIVE